MRQAAAYRVINFEDCWPVHATWTSVPARHTTIHVPLHDPGFGEIPPEGLDERRLVNLRPNGAALLRLVGLGNPPKTEAELRRQRIIDVLPDDDGHGIRFRNDAKLHEISRNRIVSTDNNMDIIRKRDEMERARAAFRHEAQLELGELNEYAQESPFYIAFRHPDSPDRRQLGIARLAGFDFDHHNHDFTMQPLVYGTVQMPAVEAGVESLVPMRLPNPRDTIWPYVELVA